MSLELPKGSSVPSIGGNETISGTHSEQKEDARLPFSLYRLREEGDPASVVGLSLCSEDWQKHGGTQLESEILHLHERIENARV